MDGIFTAPRRLKDLGGDFTGSVMKLQECPRSPKGRPQLTKIPGNSSQKSFSADVRGMYDGLLVRNESLETATGQIPSALWAKVKTDDGTGSSRCRFRSSWAKENPRKIPEEPKK